MAYALPFNVFQSRMQTLVLIQIQKKVRKRNLRELCIFCCETLMVVKNSKEECNLALPSPSGWQFGFK